MIYAFPDSSPRIASPQGQPEHSGVPGEPRGEVHQVAGSRCAAACVSLVCRGRLFHHFAAFRFHRAPDWPIMRKNVVGDQSERKHQGVRRELAARQAFQAEFRLQLRMKLFAGSVLVIKVG